MLTSKNQNIINDAIKQESGYNLEKVRNVLFILYRPVPGVKRSLYTVYESHKIKYRCRNYCGQKKLNKIQFIEP